jgi:hypothetical protein
MKKTEILSFSGSTRQRMLLVDRWRKNRQGPEGRSEVESGFHENLWFRMENKRKIRDEARLTIKQYKRRV